MEEITVLSGPFDRSKLRAEKLAAEYRVRVRPFLECIMFKIRVWGPLNHEYAAFGNLYIKNPQTGLLDDVSGYGATPEAATEQCLQNVLQLVRLFEEREERPISEGDIAYWDAEDF